MSEGAGDEVRAPSGQRCTRVADAEREGVLAALLEALPGEPGHLASCAPCREALARYQRLIAGIIEGAAAARRRPDHVARVLATAAASEASGTAQASAGMSRPGELADNVVPLRRDGERPRRRLAAPIAAGAALAALAAGVALVWWLRREPAAPLPQFAFEVVAQRGPVLRGEAQLGDLLRVTAPAGSALWVYRNDRELLLVCPRDCRRDGAALRGELPLDTLGRYQLVWVSLDRVPAPAGELERDIAAARATGASHELRELEVQ